MPLPSDADLKGMGACDAGDYVITMQEAAPEAFTHFLRTHKSPWDVEPRQKPQRCVDHLMAILAKTIEQNTIGTENLTIDEAEAEQFIKKM
eukprot:963258-Prymnesium_polylepis.1